MNMLRQIGRRIRHSPGLDQLDWLWNLLREPYHWALDPTGRGVVVLVGGIANVQMPREYVGLNWEKYEPETVSYFRQWVLDHPTGLVLDIGSSIGIFSAVALFASPNVEVVAFDPNLASLMATRRMTQYASSDRLDFIHGFVAMKSTTTRTLAAAIAATHLELRAYKGDLKDIRYQNLFDSDAHSIPTYRLDDLLSEMITNHRPLLIKCDVEGAELEVLMGASDVLTRLKPDLLLSVHPHTDFGLVQYGHTTADVEAFLNDHHYQVNRFARDSEEHWLCQYRASEP